MSIVPLTFGTHGQTFLPRESLLPTISHEKSDHPASPMGTSIVARSIVGAVREPWSQSSNLPKPFVDDGIVMSHTIKGGSVQSPVVIGVVVGERGEPSCSSQNEVFGGEVSFSTGNLSFETRSS